jgi:CBS domain-containing protein
MLVQHILPRARDRLVAIETGASITKAAQMMARPMTDLLVVCEGDVAVGVITKSDIVAEVAKSGPGYAGVAEVTSIMTREMLSCGPFDAILDVLAALKARRLQRIPVLDDARNPLGVIYVRDALQALLCEAEAEDELLRDYIQGVGYH